jgi:hypothetical protein
MGIKKRELIISVPSFLVQSESSSLLHFSIPGGDRYSNNKHKYRSVAWERSQTLLLAPGTINVPVVDVCTYVDVGEIIES